MLGISYFLLSGVLLTIMILGYRKAGVMASASSSKINRDSGLIALGAISWLSYLFVLEKSELILDKSLPPKLPFLIVLPMIVFCTLVYRKNKDNEILKAMPKTWLVYIQSFRIFVETIILYTFIEGIIPQSATFEGYNFDIMMGIAAPFVAYFLFRNGVKNVALAKFWNVFGIAMILWVALVIVTSYYQPQFWNSDAPLVDDRFFTYPYILLPGFLAPAGIFFHVISLLQLRKA